MGNRATKSARVAPLSKPPPPGPLSRVRFFWDEIEVGDIIYAKDDNTPLTIKKKYNENGMTGFNIDLEADPRPPYSWVDIDYVDDTKLSARYGRDEKYSGRYMANGGARRHKNRKSTKKARRNKSHYFRRSRRN